MSTSIRPLDRAGVDTMIAMAAAEGWNPGPADAACFFAADPGGFLGLFRPDEAEPAAVVSLVRYDEQLAFLGLYIARPDCRGLGYGWRLWQAAMELAGARTIGLDGVVAQQGNYRRSGFEPAWRNVRYAGVAPVGKEAAAPNDRLLPIEPGALAVLAAYDRRLFGAERRSFLAAWTAAPGHHGLLLRHADGALAGYGVIRPVGAGHKIGPLFADTAEAAEHLLDALLAGVPGEAVILDVPEPNAAAVRLATARGWQPVFETARMYRGSAEPLPLAQIFGITSFELG